MFKRTPKLSTVTGLGLMADRVAYSVNVTYPGSPMHRTVFTGPTHEHGPVVMVMHDGLQAYVEEPSRFGPFGKAWVRRFYADLVVA